MVTPTPAADNAALLQMMQAQLQAQAATHAQQMQFLQSQMQAQAQALAPAPAPRRLELPSLTIDDLGLSPEDRQVYSEMGPLVKAISTAMGTRYAEQLSPVLGELDQLRQQAADVEARANMQVQQATAQGFNASLYAALPGLEQTVATPAWRTYLNEAAPLSGGRTIAQVIQAAHASRDLGTLRDVYSNFQARQAVAAPVPAVTPALGVAAAGTTSTVGAGMQQQQALAQGGAQVISSAKMDELADRYRKGQISHAAYQKAMDQILEMSLAGAALR